MALAEWTHSSATYEAETKVVYRRGEGPGIVVMTELPGITPSVVCSPSGLSIAGSRWRCRPCSEPMVATRAAYT